MTDLPVNEDKPAKPVTAEQQVVQLNVRVPLHMRIKLSALSEINGVDMQELVQQWIAEKLIESEDEVRKFLSFR